jgi:hypothetical protein
VSRFPAKQVIAWQTMRKRFIQVALRWRNAYFLGGKHRRCEFEPSGFGSSGCNENNINHMASNAQRTSFRQNAISMHQDCASRRRRRFHVQLPG